MSSKPMTATSCTRSRDGAATASRPRPRGRCGRRRRRMRRPASRRSTAESAALEGELTVDHQVGSTGRPPLRTRRRTLQPFRRAGQPSVTLDDDRPTTPHASRCSAAEVRRPQIRRPHRGELGLLDPIIDHHHGQTAGVQARDEVQGALRFDDDEAVEGLGRHLGGELAHRLVTAVAGEQQHPVGGGLDGVDGALDDITHPRPLQRRDQDADHAGLSPGQADGARTGHVARVSSMTCRTRAAVRSSRSSLALSTLETVVLLTPARAATSAMVIRTQGLPGFRRAATGISEPLPVPVSEPVPEPVAPVWWDESGGTSITVR